MLTVNCTHADLQLSRIDCVGPFDGAESLHKLVFASTSSFRKSNSPPWFLSAIEKHTFRTKAHDGLLISCLSVCLEVLVSLLCFVYCCFWLFVSNSSSPFNLFFSACVLWLLYCGWLIVILASSLCFLLVQVESGFCCWKEFRDDHFLLNRSLLSPFPEPPVCNGKSLWSLDCAFCHFILAFCF